MIRGLVFGVPLGIVLWLAIYGFARVVDMASRGELPVLRFAESWP
jgi:hypothetical protein